MLTARRLPGERGLVRHHRVTAPRRATQKAQQFVDAYFRKYSKAADDYTITAYDAALVLIDAIKRVAATGKPVTREAVRDAIQTVEGVRPSRASFRSTRTAT